MALSEKELQRLNTLIKERQNPDLSKLSPASTGKFAIPTKENLMQSFKDVAIGAGKGLIQSGTGLVQGVTALGTATQAGFSPTETYSTLKKRQEEIGSPFIGQKAEEINTQLTASNTGERVGKSLEFIAELLTPTGARTAVAKGADATSDLFKGVGSKLSAIPDDIVESGVKVKDKIGDLLVNLDAKTKTALERTPKEVFQDFVKQGRDAMLDDRNITPLEKVGNNIIDGLKQIKDQASSVGQAKSKIMETAKVGYTKVGNIARQTALDIQKSFSGLKLDPTDSKIVKDFQKTLLQLGDNPRLKDVDATIDLLQDRLFKAGRSNAVEVTDRVTGRLRSSIGKLNQKIKELGGQSYSKANDDYRELSDLVGELNAKLGKEGGTAGSFVKRLFSPSDARTKQLFEILEQKTGMDFTRDARLAKFVMEALGDTRASTLLEQVPTSKGDVLSKVIKYGVDKISDPIKTAERFITK